MLRIEKTTTVAVEVLGQKKQQDWSSWAEALAARQNSSAPPPIASCHEPGDEFPVVRLPGHSVLVVYLETRKSEGAFTANHLQIRFQDLLTELRVTVSPLYHHWHCGSPCRHRTSPSPSP